MVGVFRRSRNLFQEEELGDKKKPLFSIEDEVIDGVSEALEYTVEVSEEVGDE